MDRQDIENAAEAVREIFPETPLQLNAHLSRRYGANIWLKREDLTPVRSYKLRGAFNFMRKAIASGSGQTFICASAGNHAQGFAFACRHFQVPGIVFMPVTTPQQKIDKTRMFGAEFITIRLFGDIFDQCYSAAREHVEVIGGIMVPPFDDADIIEGQATVAAEIVAELPDGVTPDLIVLPVGGGGLAAGITGYFEGDLPLDTFVFAEPAGAPSLKSSLESGSIVTLPKVDNFVDGAAVARIGDLNFAALKHFPAEQVVLIAENAICVTMIEMLNVEGVVLEPAGALSIATLEQLDPELIKDRNIVCVVSGGNFDFERLPDVKERAMRHAGLKKYFILRLAQRPGALRDFLNLLGPDDDIARFEYLKKSARNFGSILIGIETRDPANFAGLTQRFEEAGIGFEDITENDILANLII
ncbi:threonine ammonia-lyase [Rhizobiaceae bacterium BDR2-2]|uniref:L-threonine dehydratase n=1 Tax=Ectorhizobium quercum TaxID=2965071 RepID=A0AAE3MYZ6_9HYPH|nr:threonine ammonia-lyase [Ectorhizobium quercum]MCX8997848.1 threonine ammonia-lyase [Ectorhizobium quercum]